MRPRRFCQSSLQPGGALFLAEFVKGLLSDLTDRVLGAEGADPLQTGPASVANQLINTRLRAVELERKAREVDELEARLEELEAALERQSKRREYAT